MPVMLPQTFYRRGAIEVARGLLGKVLVHRTGGATLTGIITETEAYCGPHDLACHASRGKTTRTAVMFGPAGHWYVYLIYGMYHCLNVVTDHVDYPAAVLLRGVHPLAGVADGVRTDGPGKLCRAFGITRHLNTARAFGRAAALRVEDRGFRVAPADITATPRIGIDYAGEYKDKPWRFVAKPEQIIR